MHCLKITCGKYHGNIRHVLSKYVWFCFNKTCNKPPWRNLGIWIIPQIVPIKILKRQYLPKKIEEKSLTKNLCIEICTKNLRRVILYQINLEKHKYSKKYSEGKTFIYQKSLKRNHYQNISETNIYPKISKETFLANRLERGICTERKWEHVCQNLFEDSIAKTLWRNLCQTNSSRNLFQKSIGKNISTTNSLRRNLYKAVFKRNLTKIHLMKKSTQKKLYQKIFEDKIRPEYVWRKTRYQTICEGQLSTKQTLNRNLKSPESFLGCIFQNHSDRKLLKLVFGGKIPIGNFQNPKSYNCLITVL